MVWLISFMSYCRGWSRFWSMKMDSTMTELPRWACLFLDAVGSMLLLFLLLLTYWHFIGIIYHFTFRQSKKSKQQRTSHPRAGWLRSYHKCEYFTMQLLVFRVLKLYIFFCRLESFFKPVASSTVPIKRKVKFNHESFHTIYSIFSDLDPIFGMWIICTTWNGYFYKGFKVGHFICIFFFFFLFSCI